MSDASGSTDPLEFMKNLWGQMGFTVPGMVVPTLDIEELDRRIKDLRAVEGWLRMNLNMLQVTIQGLEVQSATLGAMKAMGERMRAVATTSASEPTDDHIPDNTPDSIPNPFNPAVLWPWNLVNQAGISPTAEPSSPVTPKATRSRKPRKESDSAGE